VTRRRLYTL